MTRSMNGRPLPVGSPEMEAMVAYIEVSVDRRRRRDERLPGLGVGRMPELDRAADPARGQAGLRQCLRRLSWARRRSGIRRSLPTTDLGYMVPPLWGTDSFN